MVNIISRRCLVRVGLMLAVSVGVVTASPQRPAKAATGIKPMIISVHTTRVSFTLSSNATTGFTWLLGRYNANLIHPVSATYLPPNTKLIGAPGKMRWVFRLASQALVVPHVLRIRMIYARPWDLSSASQRLIRIVTHPALEPVKPSPPQHKP